MDVIGCLDPKTGKVTEYPFPDSENSSREFFLDDQGHTWYDSPSNNKVGCFYLADYDGCGGLAGDGTSASEPVAEHARCTPSLMLGRRELDGLLEIRHIN